MDYPIEILPRLGNTIIPLDSELVIIRHTSEPGLWNDDINQIKDEAICSPKTNMVDLSTSLLGVFTESHCSIKVICPTYNVYCEPYDTVPVPIHPNQFHLINGRGFWKTKACVMDGIVVKVIIDEKEYEATSSVTHTPMRWNYYHFSIRWYIHGKKSFWHELDASELNKTWSKKRLSVETRNQLKLKIKRQDLN